MERFIIWFSYAFIAGTAVPFIFFSEVPAWEPLRRFIPLLGFIPISLNTAIWLLSATLGISGILNLLSRRKIAAVVLFLFASFFSASANYYRVVNITSPDHITNFYDASFFDKTIIRGTIIADPDQRESFTNIDIKPDEIIPEPETQPTNVIKLSGKTGYIRAKIYPSIGDYYNLISYGDRVELHTSINEPKKLTNPAGFNYAAYLRARNIYATTRPIRSHQEIKHLGVGKIPWLWRVSLALKKRILLTIRKTMPYPESAFLGGVTLGLRGGVPAKVKNEFQATGVAHVLAVSGLHVGFVAFMLVMFSKVFKLPTLLSFAFVVFGLIVFTLITGASPATRRAAIMFSMMEAFRSVFKMRLGHAIGLTIPLTAMIILIFDPLKLPDGSFVLSFMAVWSLAMISAPVGGVFRFLGRGWLFVVFIVFALSTTTLVIISPESFRVPYFVSLYVVLFLLAFIFAAIREKRSPLSGFGIDLLPRWFTTFFYAQLAIQIGMMYPLSAVYFQRFPIAGMYANFIAIPLIGFIVQYGLLAGLFNVVFSAVGLASVGESIALLINAFNWLCCRIFLGMATFFARLFPYPYIPMPTPFQLVMYYTAVLVFIFWRPLSYQLQLLFLRIKDVFEVKELLRRAMVVGVAFLIIVVSVISILQVVKKDVMRITFFDAGFGNSVLIETPDRKSILVDAGYGGGGWDFGSGVLSPTLARYKISRVDHLVLTTLKPYNIGGAAYIIKHWPVSMIHLPYAPEQLPYGLRFQDFLFAVGNLNLISNPRTPAAAELYLAWYELTRMLNKKSVKNSQVKPGDIIYEKRFGKNNLKVEVIHIPSGIDLTADAVVLKVSYGATKILLTTQTGREAQWKLIDAGTDTIKCDVLLLPKNGNPVDLTFELLEAARPKYGIIQYGYLPRAKRTSDYFFESELRRTNDILKMYDITPLRTDKNGAVILTSDGKNYSIETVLK